MIHTVSIVMVSYYTGPALWLAIDAALQQSECKELILVNNGNVPHDVDRLQKLVAQESRIIFITGHGNIGFAKGCNIGAKKATGEFILLLNPDTMLPEGALARALATLSHYPEHTLAGCLLVNPDGSEQRGSRRALLTPGNAIAESFGLQRSSKNKNPLYFHGSTLPDEPQEVPAVSGAFMMLSRAFYTSLGGMDEGYFLHMDDMDFCKRVHKAGGKVIFMPDVKVIHFLSTSEVPSSFVERHKARGFIRYLQTHFSDHHSRLFLNVMAVGIALRSRVKILFNAIDRAFTPPLLAKQEIARLVLIHRLSRFSQPQDSSLAGKTIMVLAGSGQIGLCVVGKALARGAKVIATYHTTPIAFSHPNLQWIECNLADATQLDDIHADVIIHTASLWLLPLALRNLTNCGAKRIIAFSSTAVLGKADSTNPREKEASTKMDEAEKELLSDARNTLCPVTILRPTMIYGVGLDASITRLADIARRFGMLPIYPPATGLRHPVQAQDLADAALAIIDNSKTFGKVYNLGARESITYKGMLESIFHYVGKPPRLVNIPLFPQILDAIGAIYSFTNLGGELARRMNRDHVFDIQPAIDDFNWQPHAFLEGDAVI